MKIINMFGDYVDLPDAVTREQTDAVLAALGVPSHIGLLSLTVDRWGSVTIEGYLLDGSGCCGPTTFKHTAKRVPLPAGD